jgi:acetyl-CoA carboxylase/biotin carboxylase 1
MYADEASRAGVLEPEGIVDVKFRRNQMINIMQRLDTPFRERKRQLEDLNLPVAQRAELKEMLDTRERELTPVYRHVALQFADLHDTPGRMLAKGAIRKVLQWRNARRYLYWRLRRRLAEEQVYRQWKLADNDLSRHQMVTMLETIMDRNNIITNNNSTISDDNIAVAEWLESTIGQAAIDHCRSTIRSDRVRHETAMLVKEDRVAAVQGLAQAIKAMSPAEQQALLLQLNLPAST